MLGKVALEGVLITICVCSGFLGSVEWRAKMDGAMMAVKDGTRWSTLVSAFCLKIFIISHNKF
jgi:hypothetical protein